MLDRLRRLSFREKSSGHGSPGAGAGSSGPPVRLRVLVAIVAAMVTAAWVYAMEVSGPGAWRDFDILWIAARAVLAGDNPYEVIRQIGWPWPLYHPLPAVLVDVPFAPFSRLVGRMLFMSCSSGLFAFAVTRRALWPVLFMLTAPYRDAVTTAQLSPALTASVLLPAISGLLIIKPNIGLALFLSRPSKWTALGGAALVLLSLIVWPGWPFAWWPEATQVTHLAPILRPGGFLLLLGLLRYRLPEGRLLAALALIPHRPVAYDMLPTVVLIPDNWKEALLLGITSEVAFQYVRFLPRVVDSVDALDSASWPAFLALVYIPALILVLLRPRTRAQPTSSDPA